MANENATNDNAAEVTKSDGALSSSVFKSAIENSELSLMMCDRDLNITYANPSTVRLVMANLEMFKEVFPGFDEKSLIGTNIDSFHVKPEFQRGILGNPNNLPHTAEIEIGGKKFALNVSATLDERGEYVGNCLEWSDVTSLRAQEESGARMESAIAGSATASMTIDTDLILQSANPATIALITENLAVFQEAFPNVDFNNLIGECVDVFHKVPSYQRNILSNANNLPHTADIVVGDLTFALNISAMMDAEGNYVGNNLEWQDVTTLRAQAETGARMDSAIAGSATASMTIDTDLILQSANPATIRLIKENIKEFQETFPNVDFNNLIGECVDVFHANPSYQRNILGNANNLPHSADIVVGSKTFALNISAMMDAEGLYVGNNLEWMDVTQARAEATRAESLYSMVNGASALFMSCDMDLVIDYINPSLNQMFIKHEAAMKKALPNLDVRNLIGVCIDDFHVNPAKQRGMLTDVRSLPAVVEIKVGELEFQVTATALYDADGNHIGNGAEWADLNDRAAYRDEVQSLIDACAEGDLQKRGETQQLSVEYVPMMEGINTIINAITEPITEASETLLSVAERNLTARVEGDYKGDHAAIKNNLNTAAGNLQGAMAQVNESAGQVQEASARIAGGSQQLAQGSSEQSASLEEISASLEQMTAMTSQNAENADQANSLTIDAAKSAAKGGDTMTKMSEAINLIMNSANETAKIIKTIDEIAFQTNLLALNAAVEAARAGDAGKGFAVVAEEVRSLAARSADAAKTTADLIDESKKNAENGVQISGEVGEALTEIAEQTEKVKSLVSEIAAASQEQSAGINQINSGIGQLEQVTQSNAATSEESAAAAEELNAQAAGLTEMIGTFNIGAGMANAGMNANANAVINNYQATAAVPQQRMPLTQTGGNGNGGLQPNGQPAGQSQAANHVIPLTDDDLKEF